MDKRNVIQDEVLADIEAIEKDGKLHDEKNFNLRLQAIDDIEFHIIDRIDVLITSGHEFDRLTYLKQHAEKIKRDLEYVDTKMFHQLRTKISRGAYKGQVFIDLINEYLDGNLNTILLQDATGYDNLDVFLNGLLNYRTVPVEAKDKEPAMIYYQKTPARIILELIKKAELKTGDTFFDLGSGLGQVAILVNLLTSAISKGIEFEPAFCNYAKGCAASLNLTDVHFINSDARYADYSSGTVFFMYSPFEGKMLREVLQNLHGEAKKRRISIFTYGACTDEVGQENWLTKTCELQDFSSELSEFISV